MLILFDHGTPARLRSFLKDHIVKKTKALACNRENAIADYQKALSKKNPALSPKRNAHAQARIRELSNHS